VGVGSLFRLASDVTGFNVLGYFSRNADNLLLGAGWGSGVLGYYSRAYALAVTPVAQFTNSLGGVAVPALSRLQSRPGAYRAYFRRVLTLVSLITLPPLLALCILADDVVFLVLGPQWLESAVLVRALAVAALFQPVLSVSGWHYVCLGLGRELRAWGIASVSVILLGFAVGLPWGARGVAASYAVCSNLLLFPGILWAIRRSPVRFRDVVDAVRAPVAASLFFACCVAAARWLAAPGGIVVAVAIALSAGLASMALSVVALSSLRSAISLAVIVLISRERE
jgi:PST family polysaccharide transporter